MHIWPYLVVTIPLAVAVQMSGASKYIKRAFQAKPMTAIVPATVVGALGSSNPLAILTAALAFLIAGPVTTLPAIAAVWPLVARRVFGLYVSFALAGAILIGYIYSIMTALIK